MKIFLLKQSRGEWHGAGRAVFLPLWDPGSSHPRISCYFPISWGIAIIHGGEVGLPSCLVKREHGEVALSLKIWLRSGSCNFCSHAIGLNLVALPFWLQGHLESIASTW